MIAEAQHILTTTRLPESRSERAYELLTGGVSCDERYTVTLSRASVCCLHQRMFRTLPHEGGHELPSGRDHGFSRNPEDTLSRHSVERAVPVRQLTRREVTPEIQRLDLFILGGGGILFEGE